jgi:hypothetical protein
MKTRIKLLALVLLMSASTFTAQAKSEKYMTKEQAEARVTQIKERVEQIESINLTSLDRVQRKGLRHELKDMSKELTDGPSYIYISAGALLVIIIILIIILL